MMLSSKQFIAKTTVRDTQVGYWFELNEHPEIDQHESTDKEFLIIGKNYYNQNNLPKRFKPANPNFSSTKRLASE